MGTFTPPVGGWPEAPKPVPRERRQLLELWIGGRRGKHLETWIRTDYYCPVCGKQDMWQQEGAGEDYYVGLETRCASCDHVTLNLDDQRGDKLLPT